MPRILSGEEAKRKRENEEGKKGHAIQRNMHFTVGSAIRDWYRPGAMGNDSAKAGCQDRSDLSKDSLLLLPVSSLPSQRSGNRSRGFGQGFFSSFSALVPALSPFPRICILSKGTAQLSTRSAYTESRVDNRDKIQWRLSHP